MSDLHADSERPRSERADARSRVVDSVERDARAGPDRGAAHAGRRRALAALLVLAVVAAAIAAAA